MRGSGWFKHVAMQWKRSLAQPCHSLFLSFLLHVQSGAAQGDDDVDSVTLTIATTLMENAFEIEEGGVKDGRVWRETEGNRGRGG